MAKSKEVSVSKKVYKLFVEPMGDAVRANWAISNRLKNDESRTVEFEANNAHHHAWECKREVLAELWRSRSSLGISFRVWAREDNGPYFEIPEKFSWLWLSQPPKKEVNYKDLEPIFRLAVIN